MERTFTYDQIDAYDLSFTDLRAAAVAGGLADCIDWENGETLAHMARR